MRHLQPLVARRIIRREQRRLSPTGRRTILHPRDIPPQLLQLLLKPPAKNINIIRRAIIHAPREHDAQEPRAAPSVPEPQRTRQTREHRIAVLDEHEHRLLRPLGLGVDDAAERGGGVGAAQPDEGGEAAGGDLVFAAVGDEEVVDGLPEEVGQGGPEDHFGEGVVEGRAFGCGFDAVQRGVLGRLEGGGEEVNETVERYARHDVDEETGVGC